MTDSISSSEFRADAKLRIGKLTDRDLAQFIHDSCAYVVIDLDGIIVVASRRVDEIFGYEIGDLLGKPAEVLMHESVREQHKKWRQVFMELGHAAPTRNMGNGKEISGIKKDGTSIVLAVTITMRVIHQERFAIANLIAIDE